MRDASKSVPWIAGGFGLWMVAVFAYGWRELGVQVLGPVVLTAVAVVWTLSIERSAKRFAFAALYGSAFFVVWAFGEPGAEFPSMAPGLAPAMLIVACLGAAYWAGGFSLLAVGLCGMGLAFLSGESGGASNTRAFLQDVIGLDIEGAEAVAFVLRKGTHVAFFGLLAWFGARSALQHRPLKPSLAFGLAWSVSHGIWDEWNQSHTRGRTSTWIDVVLDSIGAVLALWLLAWSVRRSRART